MKLSSTLVPHEDDAAHPELEPAHPADLLREEITAQRAVALLLGFRVARANPTSDIWLIPESTG
jgi:hypothetical protein